MKKQNIFSRIWEEIKSQIDLARMNLEESRNLNEDGSWDKYWERKRRKELRKQKQQQPKTRWKWAIAMENGDVRYILFGGFESEEEANEVAQGYKWHYVDENGFDWDLKVVEVEA